MGSCQLLTTVKQRPIYCVHGNRKKAKKTDLDVTEKRGEKEKRRMNDTDGLKRNQTRKQEDRHRGRQRKSDGLGLDRILQRDWLADTGGCSTCCGPTWRTSPLCQPVCLHVLVLMCILFGCGPRRGCVLMFVYLCLWVSHDVAPTGVRVHRLICAAWGEFVYTRCQTCF